MGARGRKGHPFLVPISPGICLLSACRCSNLPFGGGFRNIYSTPHPHPHPSSIQMHFPWGSHLCSCGWLPTFSLSASENRVVIPFVEIIPLLFRQSSLAGFSPDPQGLILLVCNGKPSLRHPLPWQYRSTGWFQCSHFLCHQGTSQPQPLAFRLFPGMICHQPLGYTDSNWHRSRSEPSWSTSQSAWSKGKHPPTTPMEGKEKFHCTATVFPKGTISLISS